MLSFIFAQNLSGIKICIDPGHSGHESDDRYIAFTGFWESEGNLAKATAVEKYLEALGANIILTRRGNGNDYPDDLSLSQRVAVANSNNVDHFHSIHSNGYNGKSNYSLMLFQGNDNKPTWDEALELSNIMGKKLKSHNRTTALYVRGDFDFYGTGQAYLGVLKNLQMPGQLSEGSFHDYIPESFRLQNNDYKKHEAWAITRSFIEYFEAGDLPHGIIAGTVKDLQRSVEYPYITGADKRLPINNITVTLEPGNKTYIGDKMNNGFFMFDSLEPGEYKVVMDANYYHADSITVTVTANKTVFADKYLKSDSTYVGEPEEPKNIHFINTSANSITAKFDKSDDADGYIIYYGTNLSSLTDYVTSDTNEVLIEGLKEGYIYYFNVKSYNDLGESLDSDETYAAIPSGTDENILIVNGFDRLTNTSHAYIRKYAFHLKKIDKGFSYALNETVYDYKISLQNFKTVIWILGDESTMDDTFNSKEQILIKTFLQGGGSLFVSGAEIGWDLEGKANHPTQADKAFYHNFLKAKYLDDAPEGQKDKYYTVEGINGKIFKELSGISFDDGTHGTIKVDWPDIISPVNGSIGCLKFQDVPTSKGFAGISYQGVFPDGTTEGKLVYLTIPYETIYPSTNRQNVMNRVMEFFDGTFVSIDKHEQTVAKSIQLNANYPNPFNPNTTISYFIPEVGKVNLKIFNINGELVRSFDMGTLSQGNYNVLWNARDNNGVQVSCGTYFYQMNFNNATLTRKMLLIK